MTDEPKDERSQGEEQGNASVEEDISRHLLRNGYTEFRFFMIGPGFPNPFTEAPAHCAACAAPVRQKSDVGRKRLFRGACHHLGPLVSDGFRYTAGVILCSRCAQRGHRVDDFIQIGTKIEKGSGFQTLVLQVGNEKVADIWRSHFGRYAEAVGEGMKKIPKLKEFARLKSPVTERRLQPDGKDWVPALHSSWLSRLFS